MQAGVGEATLKRWLKLLGFIAAYRQTRRESMEKATAQLQSSGWAAAATRVRLLGAESESVRLRAASAILDRANKGLELLGHEARLAALEEHARTVVEAYAAEAQHIQSPEYDTPAGRLLRRCLDAMSRLEHRHWLYMDIAAEVALAVTPAAEVYLDEGAALPLHDCEDCGFRIPVTPGDYNGESAVRHFRTAHYATGAPAAYFQRQKAEAASK